jgi:CHAT domain-containing protein/tetratricopeptide (TPR) repeat protein
MKTTSFHTPCRRALAAALCLLVAATGFARSSLVGARAATRAVVRVASARHVDQQQAVQGVTPPLAATPLSEGETIRKEIAGGAPQELSVALSAGQYAQVVFLWRGYDLDVSVIAPGGVRQGVGVPVCAPGPVSVSVVAGATGEYRFVVRPLDGLKINGGYEVRLAAIRLPTPSDELRVRAERALAEGTQPSLPASREKIEEALRLWRDAGDAVGEAAALHALADYNRTRDFQTAIAQYQSAAALRRQLNDAPAEGHTLVDLGNAYRRASDGVRAQAAYRQALALFRAAGDRTGESRALYNIGFTLASTGEYREAVGYYEQALAIQSATGDEPREASTLNALGGAYDRLSEYDKALDFFQRAAQINRDLGNRVGEGLILNNVSALNATLGNWQAAKESYEVALSAYESQLQGSFAACDADASEQARKTCGFAAYTFGNLGELYNTLNDPAAALASLEKSYAMHGALGNLGAQGWARSQMCYSKLLQGEPREALQLCQEALSLQTSPDGLTPRVEPPVFAYTLTVTGMCYDVLGKTPLALDYYERAAATHRKSGDARALAITLERSGEALAHAGNPASAREKFEQALPLWHRVRDHDGEALTLYYLARAERDAGRLAEAHARVNEALALVESLRTNVSAQRLRASYFAQKVDFYELAVDLKMSLAKAGGLGVAAPAELVAAAFETSERAHARVLFDILAEARVEPRATGDRALDDLLARRRQLQQRLDYKATAQTRLLAANAPAAELAAVGKEIAALAAEYDDVDAQVRARSPRYAELTKPRLVGVAGVQSRLLDDHTLLLEYSLGDARSYLWVVGQSGVKSFELRGRAEIEESARRVADTLRAEQKQPGESAQSYQSRLARLESRFREESARLSALVLAPAAAELGGKRLLVVADGELLRVPFAALPSPEAANGANSQAASAPRSAAENDPTPLAERHEIINLPSASALAALRVETAARAHAPKAVAVLADPVFDRDDSRLQSALSRQTRPAAAHAATTDARPQALDDAVRSLGAGLPRLLSSRKEAHDIVAAAPAGLASIALDFAANHSAATDPRLAQYRIVHFATHGVFNDRQPELSGVVLSLFDEQGRPREDGFLRLPDIYDLNLPVDMVVLSACQTGLGKQVRGEGFVGLTRGFMYAGAARVVASLWKVDDEATAGLMKLFYENMFRDGMSPPEALRHAQLSVRSQRRWRAPYYWAGFILQGEWK